MSAFKIDIITLFPDFFTTPLSVSLIAKAQEKKILAITTHDLRHYSNLPHKQVDDSPYGGGVGMVLRADVLTRATKDLKTKDSLVILLDPAGEKFTQKKALSLAKKSHLILVCGRYEGVDQRYKELQVDEEISIGDYVINGGEAAALVVVEAVSRLLPGVIGKEISTQEESFSENDGQTLLEYPHYTRPEEFGGKKVPDILLSGDHARIAKWRHEKALEKTKKARPDLLK